MAAGFYDLLAWMLGWLSSVEPPEATTMAYRSVAGNVTTAGSRAANIHAAGDRAGNLFAAGDEKGHVTT